MPEPVFVIRNQHGLYLTRQNEWVDGHDAAPLFKAAFRDMALNTLIELNAKDIELRGVLVEVEVNDKGLPKVTAADSTDTGDAAGGAIDDLVTTVEAANVEIAEDTDAVDEAADATEEDDEEAQSSIDNIAPQEQEHSDS